MADPNDISMPIGIASAEKINRDRRGGQYYDAHRQRKERTYSPHSISDVISVIVSGAASFDTSIQNIITPLLEEVERLRYEIERSRHFEAFLGRESDLHPLLPILNRRAFMRELIRSFDAMEQNSMPGSLALLHIDTIDRVRLRNGITERDKLLQHYTKIIQPLLTEIDLLGYFDNGDFAIFLSISEDYNAVQKIEEIVQQIDNGKITIGIVHFRNGLSPSQALHECDAQIIEANTTL